jgi:broad specificity phosphatase PhoE
MLDRFSPRLEGGHLYPVNLLLIRNGISEGPFAIKEIQETGSAQLASRLTSIHASKWRLSEEGRKQSEMAGAWIRKRFQKGIDCYLTGEYVRSLETAGILNLPNARWRKSLYLRTRDLGSILPIALWPNLSLENLDISQDNSEFQRIMEEKNRDRYYWTPPDGESIAQLALRTERVLHWIRHHVQASGTALIVTHKDVMESIRIRLERISPLNYSRWIENPPHDMRLNYGSILQYTRMNPNTKEVVPSYRWVRVVTPYEREDPGFRSIYSHHNGDEDLLAEISNIPHLF